MNEKENYHRIAEERGQLRGTLKSATGESWKDIREDFSGNEEKENGDFSAADFLAGIESGKNIEQDDTYKIKKRLRELDEQAAGFKVEKGEYSKIKGELESEKFSGFYGEVLQMKQTVSRLNSVLAKLKKQEFQISSQRKGDITGSDRVLLSDLHVKIGAIEKRKFDLTGRKEVTDSRDREKTITPIVNQETGKIYRAADLLRIQKEIKERGFATVGEIAERKADILENIQNQIPTLLEGPTGTGKTELLINTVEETFGQKAEVLNCHERVGPSEIFGKTLLRSASQLNDSQIKDLNKKITEQLQRWEENQGVNNKIDEDYLHEKRMENDRLIALYTQGSGATETYFQDGVLPRCLKKNIPLIMDEFNNMPLNMRFALKEIYNRKEGDKIIIQTDSGEAIPVPANFTFLASANLKGDKHKDRFELDDAEIRIYDSKHIGYLNKEDQYDISLVSLMNLAGEVPVNEFETTKILEMLVKTAKESQVGYISELDFEDSRGEKATLENAVFDPGQLFKMVASYNSVAHKKDFLTYLNEKILAFVNKGGYEKDRGHLVQLFQKNGFLQGKSKEDFNGGVSEANLAFTNIENIFEGSNEDKETLTLEQIAGLDPFGNEAKLRRRGVEGVIGEGSSDALGLEGPIAEQLETAIEILSEKEVIGPTDLRNIWGIEFQPEQIPEIPFSKEELERAGELDQYLILRVADHTSDGRPFTMQTMNALKEQIFADEGGGKLLYSGDGQGGVGDDCWYKGESFFTEKILQFKWALVSKEVIPDSLDQNYLEQTETIIKYLTEEVFKDQEMPVEYQEAIAEFEAQKAEIQEFMSSNWRKAADQLASLKITTLTRQTPVEVLFDDITYFLKNKEKLLENTYTWTSVQASGGHLVDVGRAASGGAGVYGYGPADRYGPLGVSLSRSL